MQQAVEAVRSLIVVTRTTIRYPRVGALASILEEYTCTTKWNAL